MPSTVASARRSSWPDLKCNKAEGGSRKEEGEGKGISPRRGGKPGCYFRLPTSAFLLKEVPVVVVDLVRHLFLHVVPAWHRLERGDVGRVLLPDIEKLFRTLGRMAARA